MLKLRINLRESTVTGKEISKDFYTDLQSKIIRELQSLQSGSSLQGMGYKASPSDPDIMMKSSDNLNFIARVKGEDHLLQLYLGTENTYDNIDSGFGLYYTIPMKVYTLVCDSTRREIFVSGPSENIEDTDNLYTVLNYLVSPIKDAINHGKSLTTKIYGWSPFEIYSALKRFSKSRKLISSSDPSKPYKFNASTSDVFLTDQDSSGNVIITVSPKTSY